MPATTEHTSRNLARFTRAERGPDAPAMRPSLPPPLWVPDTLRRDVERAALARRPGRLARMAGRVARMTARAALAARRRP